MKPLRGGFMVRNYWRKLAMAAQIIRWVLFFIFYGAFPGYLFENAGKGALGIEPRFKRNAQQGDMIVSRVLHFTDSLLHAVFVNKIVKTFFEDGIQYPR